VGWRARGIVKLSDADKAEGGRGERDKKSKSGSVQWQRQRQRQATVLCGMSSGFQRVVETGVIAGASACGAALSPTHLAMLQGERICDCAIRGGARALWREKRALGSVHELKDRASGIARKSGSDIYRWAATFQTRAPSSAAIDILGADWTRTLACWRKSQRKIPSTSSLLPAARVLTRARALSRKGRVHALVDRPCLLANATAASARSSTNCHRRQGVVVRGSEWPVGDRPPSRYLYLALYC
jgi:hypothetical protein